VSEERNLELDVDTIGRGEREEQVARVCVANATGFTRSGSAPTVTANCHSVEALEREIARLKGELDDVLERGRAHFGVKTAERSQRVAAAGPARRDAPKPKLPSTLTVADAMTRDVKTVGRNDRISVADELMKLGRFRHLVVLDEEGAIAGVVSQRDIFFGALAWSLGIGKRAHQSALESYPVKDVMATSVVTVEPATPLADAAALMMERKIGCLPVVAGERLAGILTEGDFLALLSG
jgi:CBS domain-containing protein